MSDLNIGIFGANGRMGRALVEATQQATGVVLSQALVREGSSFLGLDAGDAAGIGNIDNSLEEFKVNNSPRSEVMIDFTLPEGMVSHLQWCVENNLAMVIGTTGLTEQQLQLIDSAAAKIPVVFAANYSVGVNLTLKLLEMASRVMGNYTDIEVVEAHHRFKKDAPSGTALAMGQVIADTLGRDLSTDAVYGREGHTGERDRDTIGFATLRAGDIVGEHTVMFADIGERLEITHKATSRLTFAKGAVRAAQWLKGKSAGLYSMRDVLALD